MDNETVNQNESNRLGNFAPDRHEVWVPLFDDRFQRLPKIDLSHTIDPASFLNKYSHVLPAEAKQLLKDGFEI